MTVMEKLDNLSPYSEANLARTLSCFAMRLSFQSFHFKNDVIGPGSPRIHTVGVLSRFGL